MKSNQIFKIQPKDALSFILFHRKTTQKINSQTFVYVTQHLLFVCSWNSANNNCTPPQFTVSFERHVFCVATRQQTFFNGLRRLFNATKEWQSSWTFHFVLFACFSRALFCWLNSFLRFSIKVGAVSFSHISPIDCSKTAFSITLLLLTPDKCCEARRS